MSSMRVSPLVAVLAVFCGLVSCGEAAGDLEVEPVPFAESVAEQVQLEIVEANRYLANVRTVGDDGQRSVEKEFLLGRANSAILSRLEKVVIHGPRVNTYLYGLDNQGYGGSCGCRPPEWIDCRLNDGQEVRVFIHHGKWNLLGEVGFRLDIPWAAATAILDRSGWDRVEVLNREEVAVSEKVSPFLSKLSHSRKSLESSLMHEGGAAPLTVVFADCYVLRPKGDIYLGRADFANLCRLQEAVLGERISTLHYMPSGEVRKVHRQDEAAALIKCRMSDGQDVFVNVFSSDGSWFVVGEEDFRLDISVHRSREILDSGGWGSSG